MIAALIIMIPIGMVLVTDVPFNPIQSKVFLSTALGCIIAGKLLTALKRTKGDKGIQKDIAISIGLLIVLISNIFK